MGRYRATLLRARRTRSNVLFSSFLRRVRVRVRVRVRIRVGVGVGVRVRVRARVT